MLTRPILAVLSSLLVVAGCGRGSESEAPATATVRTNLTRATLYIDGRASGRARDGRPIQLTPGRHTIEARAAGEVLASVEEDVRSGQVLEVRLHGAQPPAVASANAAPKPAPGSGGASETESPPAAGAAPAAEPAPPADTPEEPSDEAPPEGARDCVMRGDNACVIRVLEGRADSEQELGMLIEAYRARGQTGAALRHMEEFVERYPSAARARQYEMVLERHR